MVSVALAPVPSVIRHLALLLVLLMAARVEAASVTLVWNPNNDPDLAGYHVGYRASPTGNETVVDVGNATPGESRRHLGLALPNGTYRVRLVAGDPSFTDSVCRLTVEGVVVVDGTPTAGALWIEGTATVTVTDGRLTLRSGAGGVNTKVCFVEIAPK